MAAYRGRFAPSPSGPLHFGSLVAATSSYLQALANGGEWWLRIEDIDPPRETAGASEAIVSTLAAHGFVWTGDVQFQSRQFEHHQTIVEQLLDDRKAYPCVCTRKQIRATAQFGPLGAIYPGTCRDRILVEAPDRNDNTTAVRLFTSDEPVAFDDGLQGNIQQQIQTQVGDILIRRKHGLVAYHLAVVIDDHEQGMTEIVRGVDLLEVTPVQIFLQRILGLTTPAYMHFPIAVNGSGKKLSKQTGAPAVEDTTPVRNLLQCLEFLAQDPPASLTTSSVADVWEWAGENWHPEKLRGQRDLRAPKGQF